MLLATLVGDEAFRLGGEGVNGRLVPGAIGAVGRFLVGGLLAGSDEADASPSRESDANAFSKSFACEVQNCIYRATILL